MVKSSCKLPDEGRRGGKALVEPLDFAEQLAPRGCDGDTVLCTTMFQHIDYAEQLVLHGCEIIDTPDVQNVDFDEQTLEVVKAIFQYSKLLFRRATCVGWLLILRQHSTYSEEAKCGHALLPPGQRFGGGASVSLVRATYLTVGVRTTMPILTYPCRYRKKVELPQKGRRRKQPHSRHNLLLLQ